MKKKLIILYSTLFVVLAGCGNSVDKSEYTQLQTNYNELQANYNELQANYDELQTTYNDLKSNSESSQKNLNELQANYETLNNKYTKYKKKMKSYEKLEKAEAQARQIEAEATIKAKKEEEAAELARVKAELETKEKAGYETGITYEQLARTPDDYKNEKVKFYGKVIQVMEADGYVSIRLKVNDDYNQVIFCQYDSSIVSSRVLEDDYITIYGTSIGLYSYTSTLGGQITIPGVAIDKIEQ